MPPARRRPARGPRARRRRRVQGRPALRLPPRCFAVHHRIGRHDPLLSPRAALRWTPERAHEGWGLFGRPTGAEVYVLGIGHAEFGPWGLRREWSPFDAVAVWTRILMQTKRADRAV